MTQYHKATMYNKWIVLGAGISTYMLIAGFTFSFPILYVQWLEDFGRSNSETALVQSICVGVYNIGSFVAGIAIARYGSRKCGILGGIFSSAGLISSYFATSILYLCLFLGLTGIGFPLVYVSASTIVGLLFHGRLKVIVLGFLVFGSGIGMSLFPVIFKILLTEYGWRGALLIYGGILLNIIVCCCLFDVPLNKCNHKTSADVDKEKAKMFKADNHAKGDGIDISRNLKNNETYISHQRCHSRNSTGLLCLLHCLLTNAVFVWFAFTIAASTTIFPAVSTFIIDYYQSIGISSDEAVSIYLYTNIVNTVARLFPGCLKQIPHMSVLFLPILSSIFGSISMSMFPLVRPSYGLTVLAACAFGLGYGSVMTTLTITTSNLVGQDEYPVAIGLCMTISGLMMVVTGPISGYIRDYTGSYDTLFFSASALLVLSSISLFMIMAYRHYRNNKK